MAALKTSALLARFRSLIALVLMTVALSLLSEHFLTTNNGLTIFRQVSINMCLSIGMTLVILSGGIDLSVGAILGFAGAVAAGLLKNGVSIPGLGVHLQFTTSGAILAGVAVGALLGWHNGLAITRFRLPPFIATLGMLSIARGLTFLWTGGFPITGLDSGFGYIRTGALLGVPMPVWIMTALIAGAYVLTRRARFGRHLYAVGGNERAARLTGLRVNRIKLAVYTLAGALAGVAGLIVTTRLDSAQSNAGLSYELDAIAAVVIGGTSLSGGRGTIGGTVLGALIIGVLNNGLSEPERPDCGDRGGRYEFYTPRPQKSHLYPETRPGHFRCRARGPASRSKSRTSTSRKPPTTGGACILPTPPWLTCGRPRRSRRRR